VDAIAKRSLSRLFPKFGMADNQNWGKVVEKAKQGAPDALDAVGYQGDAAAHPVCKEILASVSAGGTKGSDLHKQFSIPPYGWPKDAITGSLFALLAGGNLRATLEGKNLAGPKELPATQVTKATFYKEDEPPSGKQRMQVRALLGAAGILYETSKEHLQIGALLQHLRDLADRSGGPAPLPDPPDTQFLNDLQLMGGNQQFRAVADLHETLDRDLQEWKSLDEKRRTRETDWDQLQRLLRHAEGFPVAEALRPAVQAIREGRQLLDDPDPVRPLLESVTNALNTELLSRQQELAIAHESAIRSLLTSREWTTLSNDQQQAILKEVTLVPIESLDVSSRGRLLDALDSHPLSAWRDRISLVPSRRDQARHVAAKLLEPESVSVAAPSATIRDADDLATYLDAIRDEVEPILQSGKIVII
jgi:hypothetical protein